MLETHKLFTFVAQKLSIFQTILWDIEMKRTEWLQETLNMRFEEAYCGW